jgi:hypothetical protein
MSGAVGMRFALVAVVVLAMTSGSGVAQQRQQLPPRKPVPALQPPSQPNQADQGEGGKTQQNRDVDQRGSEDKPVIVKVLPSERTATERAQEASDRQDKAAAEWWTVLLTLALVGVGSLQFLALIGQAIVFGIQARRLRESVDLTRTAANRQEKDTAASIAEASRAAVAMERVAGSLASTATSAVENTRIVREISERQGDLAMMQLRAYLSVRFGSIVPQDNATNYRFEVRLLLANTGQTPAHNVYYRAAVDILPLPLPDDFAFLLPDPPMTSAGILGPQQIFSISANLNRMLSDDEIVEISTGERRRLYIYGTVSYYDAFAAPHFTNFSQRVEWLRGGGFVGFNTRRNNEGT